ncbi:MAG: hypothetical protein ACR2J1_08835 [Methyloceanibacter sp.]|uniref:hypothetical protein n=1 Tax=Methyloceanibacter sp. TaxID=1965321 RepID=UPI003D9B4F39
MARNASAEERSIEVPDAAGLKRVLPNEATRFAPLDERPLTGTFGAEDLAGGTVTLPAMSQAILINPATCPGCLH